MTQPDKWQNHQNQRKRKALMSPEEAKNSYRLISPAVLPDGNGVLFSIPKTYFKRTWKIDKKMILKLLILETIKLELKALQSDE